MKTWVKALLGAGAVITLGGTVFLLSRPAAAREAGRQAFVTDYPCTTVTIVDEEAAKTALMNAVGLAYKGMDKRADELLVGALKWALGDRCPVTDALVIKGIPGVPFKLSIGQIKAVLGDRTVQEIADMAAKGEIPGFEMPVGASEAGTTPRHPIAAMLAWLTGGEYPQ